MPAIAQTVIVDSNTSVVLLNTQTLTDNQDIVVLLSTSTLPGRIVSIRDTTGNMTPLRRIVISTMSGAQYYNTNFPSSVVVNQPLGFVTVTNRDPYTWVLQNTFAFPAELSVADVQGVNANYVFANTLFSSNAITTKTHLYAASTVSTTYVNTMDVLASGNLYVGSTSALSNAPRFQTTGNAVFTGNVSAWSTISTGQDVVVGRSLNVISSFNVGGSTVMFGTLSTLGPVAFASTLTVNDQTRLSNLSTFGPTIGFGADVFMTANRLNTSSLTSREVTASNIITTLNLVVNCNTSLSNLSVSGPTINVGADLYITNNSIFAASTLAKSITASNILVAPSTNTSSLTVYTLANLSSISTTGIAAFVNDVYLASNMFVASNIQVSSLSTFFMAATSTTTSTLTVTGRATITNMSTFGAIGFGDDVYINPNHTLRTQNAVTSSVSVTDLLAAGFISTNRMGVTTSIILQGAPVILTPTTWDSPMTFINISTVSTSAVVASTVRATVVVASTFVGDGSYLTNLAAISSLSLQSTIVGLNVFGYVLNTDVTSAVTAIQLNSSITGLGSAGYISSLGGSGFALSNAVATQVNTLFLNTSSIALSNSLVATYGPTNVPSPAVFLNSPQPNRNVSIDMRTGANSQLLMGVLGDAFYSARIQSIDPATGYSQPLNIYGSTIFMVAANVQVGAGVAATPYTEFTPSNVTTGTVNANVVNASNLNMNGVVVLGSNLQMTGGASSHLSNSGMLSNTNAAAYFLSTSNATTLGVAGATILASNLTMTAAAGFLSNAGVFSNASNVLLTGGTGALLSNSGVLSNAAAGAFFLTTSNTGTLGVGGASILGSNLTMTAAAGFLSNAGVFSNASNVFLTGGTGALLSNSGVLSNTGAGAFFLNTSNAGTLGVGLPTTLASNVLLTGGTNAFLSNSGILSNTAAAAYFLSTSNNTTLGVAGATILASNLTMTAAAGFLSNAGVFSNASNVLLTGGTGALLSNSGILSNAAAGAFFLTTSNTGTLGVGGASILASNLTMTAAAGFLSNAGIFSNASNVFLTGGTGALLSNSGVLSNSAAGAFFQTTSNTGTLGVGGASILASNLTMTAAAGFLSNAGIFSNASNVLLTGGTGAFLSNSGMLSNIAAPAYFQNTSNTGTLGVAQVTTLASNTLLTGGTNSYLSNSGMFSNIAAGAYFQNTNNAGTLGVAQVATLASNVLLTGGTNAFLSNSGMFSNVAAGAYFQNTSNAGTLGVAQATTLASNLTLTAAGGFFSNAGIFSNASNVLFAGSFFSNAGTLSNTAAGAFFQNTSNTGTLGVGQVATFASNIVTTGGTSSYLSNAGVLSNVQAAAYFQTTSNTGSLNVAGTVMFASNITITGGTANYLSNSGILSNTAAAAYFQITSNTGALGVAQVTTLASNALLTGGTNSFLSNSGMFSNVAAGAYFQNTSNTGTLGVAQTGTFSTVIITGSLYGAGVPSVGSWYTFPAVSNVTFQSNITMTGGTNSFLSNSGMLSNIAAGAYFQNTSNAGTLGVALAATLASNLILTNSGGLFSNAGNASNAGYLVNGGFFSNTAAGAFFQNTSNTGILGVAGITTHTSNILQTVGAAYLSNAGIFSNASNVILSGGINSYLSNTGVLSNTLAAAYFQNTSNTGTLGLGGAATLASNLIMTAAGGLFSNAGNFSNAGYLANGGALSNTAAGAFFQNTSNTGTLGVAGPATLASNLTLATAAAYFSNAGPFSNAGITRIASNVLITGGASSYLSNSGLFSNVGIATFASNIYTQSPTNATVRHIFGSNATLTNLDFCSLIQSCNNAANYGSELSFWTHGTGTNGADPTRAMTIAMNQYVGINCNSPSYLLDVNGAAQINGNLNITGTLSGGGFSAASWAQFPASADVVLGFSTIKNGFVSNVATNVATAANFTTSRPVFFARTDTGIGQADPASFNLWHGVYVKHTGSANDQTLSLYATGAASGWTITCRDDFYAIGVPLNITASVLTLTANTSNTGTLGVAGLATFVNSSNTGTLGVTGLATFVNSSNTGTLGVAGLTTHGGDINMNQNTVYNTFLSNSSGSLTTAKPILAARADTGPGAADPANFTLWKGTWVKHSLGGANDQFFSLDCTSASGGWAITSSWEFLTLTGLQFNADVVTFNATGISNAGYMVVAGNTTLASNLTMTQANANFSNAGRLSNAGITTIASNVLLTGGTSSYLSNSGILSNTGAAAYFEAATISASQPFKLDVNGTSRGAIYYSTMTTGGTLTITTNNNYGVYYNISVTGTYTIQVEATQQTSNIGKYYVFRNNSGGDLSVALTNATGITSPITIGSNTSATIVVAGVTSYALF